jgi:hypothetical protein
LRLFPIVYPPKRWYYYAFAASINPDFARIRGETANSM